MIVLSPHAAGNLSPNTTSQSWVMFVQMSPPNTSMGPIKIEGVSGDQLAIRLQEIDAGSPFPTFLIGLQPTDAPESLAQAIQARHAANQVRHDWFEPTLTLLSYIELNAQTAIIALLDERPEIPEGAVDIQTLAAFLGVSTPTIRRMVKAREIPFLRMGKALRFVIADVLASLEQR